MSPKYSKTINKIYEEASKYPFEPILKKTTQILQTPRKFKKKYRDLSYLSSDWTSTHPTKDKPVEITSETYTTPYTTTTLSTTGTKSGVECNTTSSLDDCRRYWKMRSSSESKNRQNFGTTTSSTTILMSTTSGDEDGGMVSLDGGMVSLDGFGLLSDGEVLSLGEIREVDSENICC